MNGNLIRCQNGHLFSARRYGTVCPYCNIETATQEKKETGRDSTEALEELLFIQESAPVCGWIVCISGPRQGKDYKIRSGKNFIGRADDMDIQILGDNKISRRNHGVIVFDPKKKETVLLPGDSNGIVYLNDAAVYTPTVLSTYDVIEMGDSKFAFIPFCGEQFMWEEKGS
ncbi:MAG: FHA domain-containing protein [Lachnospiraceae bacterium]|nr:FHA domain-containing protein [Lachnospiraceae bacterium]